jgi:predicted nucleotidyltransferase
MLIGNRQNPSNLTPYHDVNEVLRFFTEGTLFILKENLTGIYLTGSLSYDAFNYDSSDIDLTVILQRYVSSQEIEAIRRFHSQIERSNGIMVLI